MPKRRLDEVTEPASKARRVFYDADRLSSLAPELLFRVLTFVPGSTLAACQRVSRKLRTITEDNQLWKAVYYNRFVRPRASRLLPLKDFPLAAGSLHYSSRSSRWLEDRHLVQKGQETDWKSQYKLRHNWARGKCSVNEIRVSERAPVPPPLVQMHETIVFTVDAEAGLRAWSSRAPQKMLGCTTGTISPSSPPAAMAIDASTSGELCFHVAIGYENAPLDIFSFELSTGHFHRLYRHVPSSNGTVLAIAYHSPYLLTMSDNQTLSLYKFPASHTHGGGQDSLDHPELLHSLQSHSVSSPLSLSIRPAGTNIVACVAFAQPTRSGYSVYIQEIILSTDGQVESRGTTAPGVFGLGRMSSQPTSISYTHPYLLVAHPDNTLTLFLVNTTSTALTINQGSQLCGHTSSVSGAHVGGRGKAVSISSRGDDLRVWELEGGLGSQANRKRLDAGELSVRVEPEEGCSDVSPDVVSQWSLGLGLLSGYRSEELPFVQGWIGFDEENVVFLREHSHGAQALAVYDFT